MVGFWIWHVLRTGFTEHVSQMCYLKDELCGGFPLSDLAVCTP